MISTLGLPTYVGRFGCLFGCLSVSGKVVEEAGVDEEVRAEDMLDLSSNCLLCKIHKIGDERVNERFVI